MGPFLATYIATGRPQLITFSYLGAVSHLGAVPIWELSPKSEHARTTAREGGARKGIRVS
jgi:hypothetical protein